MFVFVTLVLLLKCLSLSANYDYYYYYFLSDTDILGRDREQDCKSNRFPERKVVEVASYSFAVHYSVSLIEEKRWCSGTVIGSDYVLSSAECLSDDGVAVPEKLVSLYTFDKSVNVLVPVKVLGITIHEDFTRVFDGTNIQLYNNLALIKVDRQFDESMIVCMPYGKKLQWNYYTASLISWGSICPPKEPATTNDKELPIDFHQLRISNYTLIDPCLERFYELSTIFCSSNHDSKGPYAPICLGDRGGSLILFQANHAAPLVIGVVSDTRRLAGCGGPFDMVIYTKISEYFQWIHNTVGSDGKLCLRYVKSDADEDYLP